MGSFGAPSGALRGAARSFERLTGAHKAAVAGIGLLALLALLTVLSPLALFASALLFGVSLIALIVRAGQRWTGQRASFVGWGVVAAGSLVLAFVFAAVSGALYGSLFAGGDGSGTAAGAGEEQYSRQYAEDDRHTAQLREAVLTPSSWEPDGCAGIVDCELIEDVWVEGDRATVVLEPQPPDSWEPIVICPGVANVAAAEGVALREVVVEDRDGDAKHTCEGR